jgi:hypothetical protein
MWVTAPKHIVYIYYTRHGAKRLDRIYLTRILWGQTWDRDIYDSVCGPFSGGNARNIGRDRNTPWKRVLENGRYPTA